MVLIGDTDALSLIVAKVKVHVILSMSSSAMSSSMITKLIDISDSLAGKISVLSILLPVSACRATLMIIIIIIIIISDVLQHIWCVSHCAQVIQTFFFFFFFFF